MPPRCALFLLLFIAPTYGASGVKQLMRREKQRGTAHDSGKVDTNGKQSGQAHDGGQGVKNKADNLSQHGTATGVKQLMHHEKQSGKAHEGGKVDKLTQYATDSGAADTYVFGPKGDSAKPTVAPACPTGSVLVADKSACAVAAGRGEDQINMGFAIWKGCVRFVTNGHIYFNSGIGSPGTDYIVADMYQPVCKKTASELSLAQAKTEETTTQAPRPDPTQVPTPAPALTEGFLDSLTERPTT